MAATIKVEDLKSTTELIVNGMIKVTINVSMADTAKGEYNKQAFNAIQEQINANFIKGLQNIIV